MTAATTERASSIHEDWVAALAELSEIAADETANTGQYSYSYASLAAVMRAVRPVLRDHRLAVSQPETSSDGVVRVETIFWHHSGESIRSGVFEQEVRGGIQQVGSMLSYVRRYQLMGMLGLAVEDDDGRSAQQAPPVPQGPELTDAQVFEIRELFDSLGVGGREDGDARLTLASDILGRDVGSLGEVRPDETTALIRGLHDRVVARAARQEEER